MTRWGGGRELSRQWLYIQARAMVQAIYTESRVWLPLVGALWSAGNGELLDSVLLPLLAQKLPRASKRRCM